MARLRHFAVCVKDLDKAATFYETVFELKRAGREDLEIGSAIYLTDGVINLALLNFSAGPGAKAADTADPRGLVGAHHFGFQVDDLDATTERLASVNAPRRDDINEALGVGGHAYAGGAKRYGNVEVKYTGPDGVTVDVSETGWVGTQTFRPE